MIITTTTTTTLSFLRLWRLITAAALLGGVMVLVVDGKQQQLCVDERTGHYLGLATDAEAYVSIPGSEANTDGAGMLAQSWTLVKEKSGGSGPQHSYDGQFLQVVPDSGRTYPTAKKEAEDSTKTDDDGQHGHHGGHHLQNGQDLEGDAPYVQFDFVVSKQKGGEGIHTLFVRWTGGDTVGGGDSFYVTLYKVHGGRKQNELILGQETVKPAVVPIDSGMSKFAGCCYDMITHACPCYSEKPADTDTTISCPIYVEREKASQSGIQCYVGGGAMLIVRDPSWYLFAGQEDGDVMDFDSEPWDVTCEAEGSNTRDSGHDFPSWVLTKGTYQLRIYAREDGTALDGIYLAGPTGEAPVISKRYTKGDSTFCTEQSFVTSTWFLSTVGVLAVLAVCSLYVHYTERGKSIVSAVLNSPAQAVRYGYIETN